jgi:hypothetical protein
MRYTLVEHGFAQDVEGAGVSARRKQDERAEILTLPCRHRAHVVSQVQPTIDLLTNMDQWHPDVLLQHDIQPDDYKNGLVFRSAVESIRGTFIASSKSGREALVGDVLDAMKRAGSISSYDDTTSTDRYDYEVIIQPQPKYLAAIEVKGGEGNSINISNRPSWADEFVVWCHLDGAVVNQPAYGAHSIINRLTNELVRRDKVVDALLFKDLLCGTHARPCPKYPGREESVGLRGAPDIFLLPRRLPTRDDPYPPAHDLSKLRLPSLILDIFGVPPDEYHRHVWEVHVVIKQLPDGRLRRHVRVLHEGIQVDETRSKAWRPES